MFIALNDILGKIFVYGLFMSGVYPWGCEQKKVLNKGANTICAQELPVVVNSL
jgi:hypothetical protein